MFSFELLTNSDGLNMLASPREERIGAWAGVVALLCYFSAAFLPLPDEFGRLLGFSFGPLFIVSFLGIHAALNGDADGIALRVGVIFGVIAGAVVTTLLTIQIGNQMWLDQAITTSVGAEEVAAAQMLWEAVNRVQALMDVSWDIFLSSGAALIGVSMVSSARFGPLWGWLGILSALLLLTLNLYTFPRGPAYVGLVDVGPILALWFGAVYVRIILFGTAPETHR